MSAEEASSLNLWSFVYAVGMSCVIAGVILEAAEIAARRMRRRGTHEPWVVPEEKIPRWVHNVADFGWLILVIGLVVESVAHNRITLIADRENARLVAKLDDTTERLVVATRELEYLQFEAMPRASRLTFKIWGSTNWAEKLDILRTNQPADVVIWFVDGDSEAKAFAGAIGNMLALGGWTRVAVPEVLPPGMTFTNQPIESGRIGGRLFATPWDDEVGDVLVVSRNPPKLHGNARVPANVVASFLLMNGFHVSTRPDWSLPPDRVVVVIGHRQ
jgi:hypothetical protein